MFELEQQDYFRTFVWTCTYPLQYSPFIKTLMKQNGFLDREKKIPYYIPSQEFVAYFEQVYSKFKQSTDPNSFEHVMEIMKRWIVIDTPEKENKLQNALKMCHCLSCHDIRDVTFEKLERDFFEQLPEENKSLRLINLMREIACVCWVYRYQENARNAKNMRLDNMSDEDYFSNNVSIATDSLTMHSFINSLFWNQGSIHSSVYYIPSPQFRKYFIKVYDKFKKSLDPNPLRHVMEIMRIWIDLDTPEKLKYVQNALEKCACYSCADIRYVTYGMLKDKVWDESPENQKFDPVAILLLQIACVCWAYRYEENRIIDREKQIEANEKRSTANVYQVNLTPL